MDSFDEGSVAAGESAGLGKPLLIGLALGVVGIVTGISGIYLGYAAGRDVDSLVAKLESEPDEAVALRAKLEEMEEGLVKLGSETVRLTRQDRQLQENVKAALEALQETIDSNRSMLNALTERVGEVASRSQGVRNTPASASAQGVGEAGEAMESPTEVREPNGGVHYVEGGDTLSKIAKQYGVSLNDLLKANPSVNPKAMQIGQQIIIP